MPDIRRQVWHGTGRGVPLALSDVDFKLTEVLSADGQFSLTIPQTADHLEIVALARSVRPGSNEDLVSMRFNVDSGAGQYSSISTVLLASGVATDSGVDGSSLDKLYLGQCPATNAPTGNAGYVRAFVPFYRHTTFHKGVTAHAFDTRDGLTTDVRSSTMGGMWRNTAAITSLTIFGLNANFLAGSSVTVTGLLGSI